MNVIAEFTLIPIGVGVSLSNYVAICERVVASSGLTYEMHANGTNLEGDWDEVMQTIKTCHEQLHGLGVPRIATLVKIGTRSDRDQTMAEKVASVRAVLKSGE